MSKLAGKVEITKDLIQKYTLGKETIVDMIKNVDNDQGLKDTLNFAMLLAYYNTFNSNVRQFVGVMEKHRPMKMIACLGRGTLQTYVFLDRDGHIFYATADIMNPNIAYNDHRSCYVFRNIEYYNSICSLLQFHQAFDSEFLVQDSKIYDEFTAMNMLPIKAIDSMEYLGVGT